MHFQHATRTVQKTSRMLPRQRHAGHCKFSRTRGVGSPSCPTETKKVSIRMWSTKYSTSPSMKLISAAPRVIRDLNFVSPPSQERRPAVLRYRKLVSRSLSKVCPGHSQVRIPAVARDSEPQVPKAAAGQIWLRALLRAPVRRHQIQPRRTQCHSMRPNQQNERSQKRFSRRQRRAPAPCPPGHCIPWHHLIAPVDHARPLTAKPYHHVLSYGGQAL